jgi:hypothetical protein
VFAVTEIVALALPPEIIDPIGHETVPQFCVQAPPGAFAELKVTEAGRTVVVQTLLAVFGPALWVLTVQVTAAPTRGFAGVGVSEVTDRLEAGS